MPSRDRRPDQTTSRWTIFVAFVLVTAAFAAPLPAQSHSDQLVDDLASLDLEELARIRVTSAGRKPELVARTTAAITVITREDIRRSGAGSIPEALRPVPGLEVARVGTRDWAVSARGFNQQSANKLLLLVDGRTVYSPIFAGVFWDAVAMPFDEIDRIEVIRGPGATLWGANAVNGVINVITRPAAESRGGRLTVGVGTGDRVAASARLGGSLGAHTAARVYAVAGRRDRAVLADGSDAFDDWGFGQAGFRLDAMPSDATGWMVQGNAFVGEGGNRLVLPVAAAPYAELRLDDLKVGGVNLTGRWTRHFTSTSDLSVQASYDYSRRRQTLLFGTMTVHIAEAELQHRLPLGERHDLLWGAGIRLVDDEITGAPAISFVPTARTTTRVSAFLQDDITLVPGRVVLALGSKVGDDNYTGFGIQPNARLRWAPNARQTVWGAVSRALRAGGRIDVDLRAVTAAFDAPAETRVFGNTAFDAEELTAYELGYRVEPHARLGIDLALFYNDYDNLRTFAYQPAVPASPRPIVPIIVTNQGHGRSYGAETTVTVGVTPWWRLRGTYAHLQVHAAPRADAPTTVVVDGVPADDPEHQASLRSSIDVAGGGEFDLGFRYVSALEGHGIPSYVTTDVRAGWRQGRRIDFSIVGQDLLHAQHAEFPTFAFIADQRFIERRVYTRVTWRF